jgi:hypothetical protein
LFEIFSKEDRRAIYQWRVKSVLDILGNPWAGMHVSYSGILTENISSLGSQSLLGYSPAWADELRSALQYQTPSGHRRMDIVGFTYHHAIAPLLDPESLKKEIQLDQLNWQKVWGPATGPKGFRCAEESFSPRIIKALVEAGYEWVIVPNHHLARTHSNYKRQHHKGVYDNPNRADQINPPAKSWWSGEIDGRGATLSIPFSYQSHWAQYVDPASGKVYRIIVVPMADLLSYRDGYSAQGTEAIDQQLVPHNISGRPLLTLFSHDGDNAWGGGHSYYMGAVPQFVQQAANRGYKPTTIDVYLKEDPPPIDDVVHVEDGSWINAEGDWGHPQFINWLWYPQRDREATDFDGKDPATYAHIEGGWAEDFRNWAVITAAQNYVTTAEQVSTDRGVPLRLSGVLEPQNGSTAEKAWSFFLPALTSGYMYYGMALDMEVKPTLAANQGIEFAQRELAIQEWKDRTSPSVFVPQRYPYNPGSENIGPQYGYRSWISPTDFYVWTFVHDISGVAEVRVFVRVDKDGVNPLNNIDNETYAGGPSVGAWKSLPMLRRDGQSYVDNMFKNPEIDFFIQPKAIADQYYLKLSGFKNQLLDYYVEARDRLGNIKRSDIFHVWVGSGNVE